MIERTAFRSPTVWIQGVLFVFLNLIDTWLTFEAVGQGNHEVGLLYRLTGNLLAMSVNKMLLALLVAGALVWAANRWAKAGEVLIGLNIGFLVICLWNAGVLLHG